MSSACRRIPKTRLVIADAHILFRCGLRKLLETKSHLEVVGEAGSGGEILPLVRKTKPHILLLDLHFPNLSGSDLLVQLPSPMTRAILLTNSLEPTEVATAFRTTARGIVLKDAATDSIFNSIDAVMSGQYWIHTVAVPELEDALATLASGHSPGVTESLLFKLTQREIEVLQAIVSGYSNKTIAAQFGISEQTVKHHVTNIFNKTGASNRLELTLFAVKWKVIGLGPAHYEKR